MYVVFVNTVYDIVELQAASDSAADGSELARPFLTATDAARMVGVALARAGRIEEARNAARGLPEEIQSEIRREISNQTASSGQTITDPYEIKLRVAASFVRDSSRDEMLAQLETTRGPNPLNRPGAAVEIMLNYATEIVRKIDQARDPQGRLPR